jgi:hypothetical protein
VKIFEAYDMLTIEHLVRPGDVYVEIGAHRGQFFRQSGVLILQGGGTYHLYEPGPVRAELEETAAAAMRGRLGDVKVWPEAVWFHGDGMPYYAAGGEGQGNGLVAPGGEIPMIDIVPTVTLETVVARAAGRVRFLAMNAEQAEYAILRSRSMAYIEYATVEFHPGKSGIDTKQFIRQYLPDWETLQFGREGEAYNQWLGRNTRHLPPPGGAA